VTAFLLIPLVLDEGKGVLLFAPLSSFFIREGDFFCRETRHKKSPKFSRLSRTRTLVVGRRVLLTRGVTLLLQKSTHVSLETRNYT
jgi:hypothetical protein